MDISPLLENKIKGLAESPGVYLMKDVMGQVLYVGKAKNLKSRVSSYFQSGREKHPRIELLVRKIDDFEVVLTDSEVEALILEFNLIKKHKPRYNVRLKDDKSYPYLRLDVKQDFPRLEYVRRTQKDGARYFGPYVSSTHLKDVIAWSRKVFQLRDCSDNEFRNRSRPCILYQMRQCSAPCVGNIDVKSYTESIQNVLKILNGKTSEVIALLQQRMLDASEKEQFELAAQYRDQIQFVESIDQNQKITDPQKNSSRDVVHFARSSSGKSIVVVMSVREGRAVGVLQFPVEEEKLFSDAEFLFSFLSQFYLERYEKTPELLPKEVLIPFVSESAVEQKELESQLKLLTSALGKTVEIHSPRKGESKELIDMVYKTASHRLDEMISQAEHSAEDLQQVQKKLDLSRFPKRIECFDISHLSGKSTVASRVVFVDGKPEKQLYRHYHVKEVSGIDDFKSMREILERRFAGDPQMPDLVVIDGGKGQLSQVEAVFSELGVLGVDLVSLAKARTEKDFEESEVESSMERVFKPGQKNPIFLKPGTGAFRVLTQVRDEAHRFAITFQRKTRTKKLFVKNKVKKR